MATAPSRTVLPSRRVVTRNRARVSNPVIVTKPSTNMTTAAAAPGTSVAPKETLLTSSEAIGTPSPATQETQSVVVAQPSSGSVGGDILLGSTFETFLAKEATKKDEERTVEALGDLLSQVGNLTTAKPPGKLPDFSAKPFQTPKSPEKDCSQHWISKNTKHSNRVVSWCVVSGSGSCDGYLCYDVDEVQAWIQSHGFPKKENAKGAKCPMFMPQETQAKVNSMTKTQGEIVIPVDMPLEFMQVFMEYDLTNLGSTIAKFGRDRILDAVRVALEDWLRKQANRADVALDRALGVFWTYTKKAVGGHVKSFLQTAWDWTWYLLKNPYYLAVMAAVSRLLRMFICVYIALPHLGVEIMIQIIEQTLGDVKNAGFGLASYFIAALEQAIRCFGPPLVAISAGGVPDFSGLVRDCALGSLYTHLGGIFVVMRELLSSSVQSICDYIGWTGVSDFVYVLARRSDLVFETFKAWALYFFVGVTQPGELGRKAETALVGIFRRFNVLDWNTASVLFFLSYCPAKWIDGLLQFVLIGRPDWFAAYQLARKTYGIHPIVFLKYLAQHTATFGYAAQILNEIKEWVFDVIPCALQYFIDYVKSFFNGIVPLNEDEVKTANEAAACCMVNMVQEIQKQFQSNKVVYEYKERMWKKLTDAKEKVKAWFANPTQETAALAQEAIDEAVESESLQELNDRVMISASSLLNLSNATPAALELPKAYIQELVPLNQTYWEQGKAFISNNTVSLRNAAASAAASVFGFASDARDKRRLASKPVCYVHVQGKLRLPMYLFTWEDTAPIRDSLVHVSVFAQDVEDIFPDAIVTCKGRKFIAKDRIPSRLAQRLSEFGNPMIRLTCDHPFL